MALRFTGSDNDINVFTDEPEFCEWKWLAPHELVDLAVPLSVMFTKSLNRLRANSGLVGQKNPLELLHQRQHFNLYISLQCRNYRIQKSRLVIAGYS